MKHIEQPGIYPDISHDHYHADPCPAPSLSSSIGKVLLNKSPRHAWTQHPRLNPDHVPQRDQRFDIGSSAHAMMLHDDRDIAVAPEEFKDWRKGDAKKFRDAAYAEGRIPLLTEQHREVCNMVNAGREQIAAHDLAGMFVRDTGQPEVSLIWREEDVWCRCRPDWMPTDRRLPTGDYKTTQANANPWGLERFAYAQGWDFQAAFYRRGFRAAYGADTDFVFVVQEVEPPYALSAVRFSTGALDMADRKVDAAIKTWRECLSTDEWPGYAAAVLDITPPPWEETRWIEREEREADPKLTAKLMLWQAPLPPTKVA